MIFKLTAISIVLFITTVVNFFTTYISWQRRKTKAGKYFAWGMMAITFWTFAAGMDYAAIPISLKIFFAKLEYVGYNSALAFLVWSTFSYVGYERWLSNKWFIAFFSFLPLSNIFLVWTNDLHGLVWSGYTRNPFADNVFIFEHGPAFIWVAISGYLLFAAIVLPLWLETRKGSELSRYQARILFYATLIPLAGNIIYLLQIPSLDGVDWSSISFSLAGFIFILALYGARFLDIVPIARYRMIEGMADGVLVLDANNRVVDFNLAAKKLFFLNKNHLGEPVELVMAAFPTIVELSIASSTEFAHLETGENKTTLKYLDAQLTLLEDNHNLLIGKLLVFRDITEHYRIEQALGERVKELKCIYDLSQLVERPGISLNEILKGGIQLIAMAMQFPEQAWARLLVEGRVYQTENYQSSANKLSQDISIAEATIGTLEVGYISDRENEEHIPFLEEEEKFLLIMAGRLEEVIKNVRDEEALRDNEKLLRTIAENYPNSFLSIIEKDFTISFSAGQEFTKQNLDPEQFIGLHIKDIFGDKAAFVQEHYEKTFDGEEQAFELSINDQYQLYSTVPLYAKNESVQRVLVVVENITERVLSEQKLVEARGQLLDQQRTLAKVEERRRLGRDLHDSVSQSIHSMVLFSETLAATIKKNDFERAEHITNRLQESARQSHKETRLLLYQLQAEEPKRSIDLIRDLEERLATVERHTGVRAQIIRKGPLEYIPLEWHENLFWITIEALNNALKHAQARGVRIEIRVSSQDLELEVKDNGVGFHVAEVDSGGIGLKNMRERAELLGGELRIESVLGEGTSVCFHKKIKTE